MSFPNYSQGVIFAFCELAGIFSLLQLPIVDSVKTDYVSGFDNFRFTMLGMLCATIPFCVILVLTAFKRLPHCLQQLDESRQQAIDKRN